MRMGQGVRTGLGHGGITCVFFCFFCVVLGHSICFYWKLGRVGFKLSSSPHLIWRSAMENVLSFFF